MTNTSHMHPIYRLQKKQHGLSLVELLVAMALTLVIVSGAIFVYLGTRETQRAQERVTESAETGAFALQLLGREIANAGFYPSTMPPTTAIRTKRLMDSYPPNDGIVLAAPFLTGIFGCDGAKFDPTTKTCPAAVAGAADSIAINYFTTDALSKSVGQRQDCTGAEVSKDAANTTRKFNVGNPATTENTDLPPQLPLFVSNRYALNTGTTLEVDKQTVTTKSLSCNGSGTTAPSTTYTPTLAGIEDMQITYGVYNTEKTRAPDKFYTATQVGALTTVNIEGISKTPWARVVAVRVCLISRTLGGSPKIADKTGALRTYVDCNETTITPPATDRTLYKRYVQTFGVRNQLNQAF